MRVPSNKEIEEYIEQEERKEQEAAVQDVKRALYRPEEAAKIFEAQTNSSYSKMTKFFLLAALWTIIVVGYVVITKYPQATMLMRNAFKSATKSTEEAQEDEHLFDKYFQGKKYIELTPEELRPFDGSDPKKPILLAIKGKIFDVTKGRSYYGEGGGYNFFAGRDGTRSFSTGCFDTQSEECTKNAHDYSSLDDNQKRDIEDWAKFYEERYRYVGIVKR